MGVRVLDAVYVSLVTVARLGFGDVVPRDGWLRIAVPVQALLREIGVLQADLRFVHLNAHLAMKALLTDAQGGKLEILSFCPRFERSGRMYRPVAYCRIVTPVAGSPRLRVRLAPTKNWGDPEVARTRRTAES